MEVYVVHGDWDLYNNGCGSEVFLYDSLKKAQDKLESIFQNLLKEFEEEPLIHDTSDSNFNIEFENACCYYWYVIEKQEVL